MKEQLNINVKILRMNKLATKSGWREIVTSSRQKLKLNDVNKKYQLKSYENIIWYIFPI